MKYNILKKKTPNTPLPLHPPPQKKNPKKQTNKNNNRRQSVIYLIGRETHRSRPVFFYAGIFKCTACLQNPCSFL